MRILALAPHARCRPPCGHCGKYPPSSSCDSDWDEKHKHTKRHCACCQYSRTGCAKVGPWERALWEIFNEFSQSLHQRGVDKLRCSSAVIADACENCVRVLCRTKRTRKHKQRRRFRNARCFSQKKLKQWRCCTNNAQAVASLYKCCCSTKTHKRWRCFTNKKRDTTK